MLGKLYLSIVSIYLKHYICEVVTIKAAPEGCLCATFNKGPGPEPELNPVPCPSEQCKE